MSDDGQKKHDESQDGGDWVHDEERRKSEAGGGGEVVVVGTQRADIVADLDGGAAIPVAVPKDAKVGSLPAAQGNTLDDGSRQNREEEQGECGQKEHRQRRRGAQHGDPRSRSRAAKPGCVLRGLSRDRASVLETRPVVEEKRPMGPGREKTVLASSD